MKLAMPLARLALISGIAGASLLSLDFPGRNYGYILFLISAICSCIVLRKSNKELFWLNATFGLINLNGIYQFLL